MEAAASAVDPGRRAWIAPLVRGALLVVGAQLIAYSLLRGVFFALFRSSAGALEAADVRAAFVLGARFDLRVALWLVLPLLVVGWIGPLRPERRLGAALAHVWIVGAGALVTLVYLCDFAHYDYMHVRLDAKALDELHSPREALGMIWESYPVVPELLVLALVAFGWFLLARRFVTLARRPAVWTARRRALSVALSALAVALGIYGNLAWYPLRWSQAFFGTDPFVSALASNPLLYFLETLTNRGPPPDRERVARDYELLAGLMEVEARDPTQLSFARRIEPASQPSAPQNLVVIHLESFAAFQTGALGNPLPSSPNFDALARESLLFTHFFVPSGPTARSVFSMLTGVPDIPENNPENSASRDPGLVRQPTLVNALAGYETHYFLGGSANWANIRALFSGNVAGIHVHEEGEYDRPHVDVWGVSDLDLLEAAIETLDRSSGPFFAFIQTAGNHPPYTIPPRTEGFASSDVDAEELQRAGFKSREAYDGFRFLDHALGRFFALARERPWYRNTVFALYGDHGVPAVNGIPFERIGLVRHHVPLVIHAPALIHEGRRIDEPASSVDILPTCLSLMGVPYTDDALGRDALAERPSERRFAFLSDGMVLGEWFLHLGEDGHATLHRYASTSPELDLAAREPERVRELTRMHDALQAWALWTEHDAAHRLARVGSSN